MDMVKKITNYFIWRRLLFLSIKTNLYRYKYLVFFPVPVPVPYRSMLYLALFKMNKYKETIKIACLI